MFTSDIPGYVKQILQLGTIFGPIPTDEFELYLNIEDGALKTVHVKHKNQLSPQPQ